MYSPIEEMINSYLGKNPARFHMPGHKGKLDPADLTEISDTDNLMTPQGAIAEAQAQAAEAFGAMRTLFCTCGATAGVLAMLLAIPWGSTVALFRDCHRSAANGLALGGHSPIWVNDENVCSIIAEKKPFALLVTSPNYLGVCKDLNKLSGICRENGTLLLVDEAHGAHFAFSETLPESAAKYAAMWVDSAHKTLFCSNQGAYVHLGRSEYKNKPTAQRLKDALFSVHTTSPSFPLLCQLDKAWRIASRWDYSAHIDRVDAVRDRLAKAGLEPVFTHDKTRLVIDVSRVCSGYSAGEQLERAGVFMEMCDHRQVVAITTPIDPDEWYQRLANGLLELKPGALPAVGALPPLPPVRMTPAQTRFLPTERIALSQAAGRIAAEPVGVYPPGSAVVAAGEEFTTEAIEFMMSGGELFGADEGFVTIVST